MSSNWVFSDQSATAIALNDAQVNKQIVLAMPAVAGMTNYVTGFTISGVAPSTLPPPGAPLLASLANVQSGIAVQFAIPMPTASATIPLMDVNFNSPIPGSTKNQSVQLIVPSFGAGSGGQTATLQGFCAGLPHKPGFFGPLYEAFSEKGTQDLGVADTGQAWFTYDNGLTYDPPDRGVGLSIINGILTNTTSQSSPAGQRAGYIWTGLGKKTSKIGATFVFVGPTFVSGDVGSIALATWSAVNPFNYGGTPTSSACHFVISRGSWHYDVLSGDTFTTIASGSFAVPLAGDGTTIYSVLISISGSTASIYLPDGSHTTVTDSRIDTLGRNFPCFEVYQANASINSKGGFVSVSAS